MTPKTVARNTYRLSAAVDAWLTAEAERLGVSKNAVVDMKLAESMNASAEPFTPAQYQEIGLMIEQALAGMTPPQGRRVARQWGSEAERKRWIASMIEDNHD